MDVFQRNTVRSFRKVKEDIKNLQAQITDLNKRLEEVMEEIDKKSKSKSGKK